MRAVGMLAHESRALSYLWYGRVAEGIEEIILSQDQCPLVSFRIDVLIWLERLVESTLRGRGEAALGKSQFWWCWTFGGVISLRRGILGEWAEDLGRA